VAQEKKNRMRIGQDPVQFRETVSSVEDDVVIPGGDEDGKGIAGFGVIPAICAKKNDLHGLRLLVNRFSPFLLFMGRRFQAIFQMSWQRRS
jgi:hypothetical protein